MSLFAGAAGSAGQASTQRSGPVSFKAGKMTINGKRVTADPKKGMLVLKRVCVIQ